MVAGLARRLGKTAAIVLVVLVCFALAGAPVYVRPQVDPLPKADAIIVLGGHGDERNQFGIDLATQGWAPIVVLSGGFLDPVLYPRCWAPGPPVNIMCFTPDPTTTAGEARQLGRLAEKYGWRKVIAVTFQPHISRARYILQRCFDGELIMTENPAEITPTRWVFEYFYQTAGYVKALLGEDC